MPSSLQTCSRHALVVAAEYLDIDTLGLQRRNGFPCTGFRRIIENDETGQDQISFVGYCRPRTIGIHLPPRDAKGAKPLCAELVEGHGCAAPRGVVKQEGISGSRLLIPGRELDDIFGRALRYQQAAIFMFEEDRNAASLEVERHLIDLDPAGIACRAGLDDCDIERVS